MIRYTQRKGEPFRAPTIESHDPFPKGVVDLLIYMVEDFEYWVNLNVDFGD